MVVINLTVSLILNVNRFSKCQGFKPEDAKEAQRLMDNYGKYSDLMSFDSDPGEGKRLYKIRNGLKGGYADRNKKDPVTNKKLRNPYFGRDVMCGKCDTCPPGWKHIRGCMGTNDDENTVCQRTIDKESYLEEEFHLSLGVNSTVKIKFQKRLMI